MKLLEAGNLEFELSRFNIGGSNPYPTISLNIFFNDLTKCVGKKDAYETAMSVLKRIQGELVKSKINYEMDAKNEKGWSLSDKMVSLSIERNDKKNFDSEIYEEFQQEIKTICTKVAEEMGLRPKPKTKRELAGRIKAVLIEYKVNPDIIPDIIREIGLPPARDIF